MKKRGVVTSGTEERQKGRVEGLRSRLLLWRSPPQSTREDLENIYMLLFPFVGNGFQLALCNVSWLLTWGSVVLVPDSIVFAQWSLLLDRGEPCDGCQDTPREAVSACFLSRRHRRHCPTYHHQSTGILTLAMEWTA